MVFFAILLLASDVIKNNDQKPITPTSIIVISCILDVRIVKVADDSIG